MPIKIQYDGPLDIATGLNREQPVWKNREWQWSELLKKISTTATTNETFKEYIASKREVQDKIKDVGGFIGGFLAKGRRKANSVVHRQLLTLDMDYGKKELWEDFTMLYGNAAAIYSTHKHSSDNPRYRLIVPLDRECTPDEFKAISRRIAENLGIDYFDHSTSFKPSQLMYWPSTSKDGVFSFEYQDGEWLNANEVLATYHDWRDSSSWPMSSRENTLVDKAIKKQGDPLEKPGVVGAFCRTYDIHETITTFLADVYEPCDVEDRYTYKEGSTSAGLVTYEDKYAFSHHGTDPISGRLCNAFDLVRLHKFGLSDEDVKEGTPINKLPSYMHMHDFATADSKVKKIIVSELLQSAKEDFDAICDDEPEDDAEEDNDDWITQMDTDRKGNLLSTINNIFLMLQHDRKLKDRIAYDEFESRLVALKDLPWRKVTASSQDFTDDDDECLAHYLEHKKIPFTYIQKAMAKQRIEHKFHPVRDYLEAIEWDGESRIETLFIDYLGAEDSAYTREVTRKMLIGGVARIFHPGCQFDRAVALVGRQGIGKSTIISKLAGRWYSTNLGDVHSKEAMENLRGIWIMEIAEFAKLKNADVDAVKNFMSTREDIYRPAYGRKLARFLRQCIFIVSVNNRDFLRDMTGNRRFDPVDCEFTKPAKSVFKDLTQYEIDQVWAEARHYQRKGETTDLSAEVRAVAEAVQEAHTADSGQKGLIIDYIDKLLPVRWEGMNLSERRAYLHYPDDLQEAGKLKRKMVCVAEIWCELFKKEKGDMNSFATKEIHEILRNLKGWKQSKSNRKFSVYGLQRAYERVYQINGVNAKETTPVYFEMQ
jgi:putative DNA primase/helicase